MELLTRRDLISLLEFLGEIYKQCDLPKFRSRVVRSLPALIPSEVTGYNEIDTVKRRLCYAGNPPDALNFRDAVPIFERHIHEHPLIAHSRVHDPRILKISDFLSRSQFRRLGLYQDFFRQVGTEFQMVCVLNVKAPSVVGIALNRTLSDFTERERLRLTLARPHLVQAYNNAAAMTRLLDQATAAERRVGEIDGLAILNEDGRAQWIAPGVRKLLRKYFGANAERDRLPECLRDWVRRNCEMLSRFQAPQPLLIRNSDAQLIIRALPDRRRVVLLLEEEPIPGHRPHRPLWLTSRESEVLEWVAQGKSNSEIGLILRMSVRTVHKHIEHIFEKLGVETRTAAAARFWEAGSPNKSGAASAAS